MEDYESPVGLQVEIPDPLIEDTVVEVLTYRLVEDLRTHQFALQGLLNLSC